MTLKGGSINMNDDPSPHPDFGATKRHQNVSNRTPTQDGKVGFKVKVTSYGTKLNICSSKMVPIDNGASFQALNSTSRPFSLKNFHMQTKLISKTFNARAAAAEIHKFKEDKKANCCAQNAANVALCEGFKVAVKRKPKNK